MTFETEGSRVIPINDKSSNFSLLSQVLFKENADPLYIHLNYFRSNPNYLFINSFADPALDLVLEFENEGPNGVGSVTEFYFHSYDSIFLIDRYRYMVSLADSSGKVKQSYRLKENESNRPDEDSVLPMSTSQSRMFLMGKFLYIPCVPDTDPFKSQYKRKNLLIKLNLETGDYTTLLGYPEWYQDGNFWGGPDHMLPSISPSEDQTQVLVSFPLVDSVYMLDLKTERMTPYFWMGSSTIESPIPIDFADRQLEIGKRFQLATDYYFSLNYDPHRKEYWRVFHKKYDEESIEKILKRESGTPNRNSVIVYDEKLERIGEFDLDVKWRANAYDLFFLNDGVYMSATSDSIEDQLIFRQLSIQ
ncbi:DUF4221 family protein [Algoriphagus aquimarinus]|nr:DUF4221 family protein [Algoriphagus aquimarinus]